MKKILHILMGGTPEYIYKDNGMILYSLGKYYSWRGGFAYLDMEGRESKNQEFEKYCKIFSMGNHSKDYSVCKKQAQTFIKHHIKEYDVVYFFNYGSTNYKLAYLCKKLNPSIKVYCKLDMSQSGFRHFYEDGWKRKIKNWIERKKSKYVDLFTVESSYFYTHLRDTQMFKGGRLQYLPNGVSELDIDKNILKGYPEKENILITVGRLGTEQKNTELLLEALAKIEVDILKKWKVYLVGPVTEEFQLYAKTFFEEHPYLKNYVVLTGPIYDRNELYRLYAKSKIMCMTSRFEGFCIAVLEGLYFGCYPIVTEYGHSVWEITDKERVGCVVPQEDAVTLAEKISYYMEHEEELQQLNRQCQDFAREQYDYRKIASRLDGYLNALDKIEKE